MCSSIASYWDSITKLRLYSGEGQNGPKSFHLWPCWNDWETFSSGSVEPCTWRTHHSHKNVPYSVWFGGFDKRQQMHRTIAQSTLHHFHFDSTQAWWKGKCTERIMQSFSLRLLLIVSTQHVMVARDYCYCENVSNNWSSLRAWRRFYTSIAGGTRRAITCLHYHILHVLCLLCHYVISDSEKILITNIETTNNTSLGNE